MEKPLERVKRAFVKRGFYPITTEHFVIFCRTLKEIGRVSNEPVADPRGAPTF